MNLFTSLRLRIIRSLTSFLPDSDHSASHYRTDDVHGDQPWQVWDDEAEAGMTDQQVQMLRQGYVMLPDADLTAANRTADMGPGNATYAPYQRKPGARS